MFLPGSGTAGARSATIKPLEITPVSPAGEIELETLAPCLTNAC